MNKFNLDIENHCAILKQIVDVDVDSEEKKVTLEIASLALLYILIESQLESFRLFLESVDMELSAEEKRHVQECFDESKSEEFDDE